MSPRTGFIPPYKRMTEADANAHVASQLRRDRRSREFDQWRIAWPCCRTPWCHRLRDVLERRLAKLRDEEPDLWDDAAVVARSEVDDLPPWQDCPTHAPALRVKA